MNHDTCPTHYTVLSVRIPTEKDQVQLHFESPMDAARFATSGRMGHMPGSYVDVVLVRYPDTDAYNVYNAEVLRLTALKYA